MLKHWIDRLEDVFGELTAFPFLWPFLPLVKTGEWLIDHGTWGVAALFPVCMPLFFILSPFIMLGLFLTPGWWILLSVHVNRENQ